MLTSPSPPKSARKRTASSFLPISPPAPLSAHDASPRILRRQHHRRRNIAAQIWGPDIPLTPFATTPLAQSHQTATQPNQPLFNVYKSLLRHPNLFFQLAIRLPYASMISLYAIDKEFHYRLNKYSVSLIHEYAQYWAPIASHVFSWSLFPDLCISDPMLRPMDGRNWLARDVPGFRWVGMVLGRQELVREIILAMEEAGHQLGNLVQMEEMLCKFWSIMEIPQTVLRTAFVRDKDIWTNADIETFTRFLVKLDMRFSDPVRGNGTCALSHLLLGQRSLQPLHGLLTGRIKASVDYIAGLVIRTYNMDRLDVLTVDWLDDPDDTGVDEREWGLNEKEGWSQDGKSMPSCLDLVVAEGVWRKLHLQERLLDFVLETGRGKGAVRGKKERAEAMEAFDARFGIFDQRKLEVESANDVDERGEGDEMSVDGSEDGNEDDSESGRYGKMRD